jgi:hypothetical protein
MNSGVDMKLMESLTIDDIRDFNSIEIDNIRLQNDSEDKKIPDSKTNDDKLIVVSNEAGQAVNSKSDEIKYDTLNESVFETIVKYFFYIWKFLI